VKTVDTLVRDVYKLMETKELDPSVTLEAEAKRFGAEMEQVMLAVMNEKPRTNHLRLSQVGKPNRMIFNQYNGIKGEDIAGATYIKFLYGHLVEAMMVSLVRMSGHTVTDQQKTVEVGGVKGHIDGYIDGVIMDVKSASGHAFKKFSKGTLHNDDAFGYIGQLRAYAYAEGQDTYGWLAMCKQSGQIAWLQYDDNAKDAPYSKAIDWSVPDRVNEIKKLVGASEAPEICYSDVSDGASGNRKLAVGCHWCGFKNHCWPALRTFSYANGPKYLTHVSKTPRVMEVPDGF
jgi:hypothetical protein